MMKTTFTFLFLFFGLFAFAQADNNKIIEIRQTVEHINKDSGYTIKKLNSDEFLEEPTDNGAEVKIGRLLSLVFVFNY